MAEEILKFNQPEETGHNSRDLLQEKTHDEIPKDIKIADYSDFVLDLDRDRTEIFSLILRDNNGYSSKLSISRDPDKRIKLEYARHDRTDVLGEIPDDKKHQHLQEIHKAFIEYKRSNKPNKFDEFLGTIFDNTEFEDYKAAA